MKIYLVDNLNTGHHNIYQRNLNNIKNTIIKNEIVSFKSIKQNIFFAYKQRKQFLKNTMIDVEKDSIVHFLYIDSLYKCPLIYKELEKFENLKLIGTLHWIPKSKISIYMLKNFCSKLKTVIVHSEFLKQKLEEIGIKNVNYIDYPSFIDIDIDIDNNEEKNDKIIISCLGGTRSDKGLDILLKAFQYIDDEEKDKIKFNIAGKEQDIKFIDIIKSAKEYNINVTLNNKFLTEKEYECEISKSNVILLPYKKIFSGNSGPMTDGVFMNKFILGPNEGNLGYLINKYDLGLTFEQENSRDLASKISILSKINLKKNHEYRNELTIEKFIKKHENLYKSIEGKC